MNYDKEAIIIFTNVENEKSFKKFTYKYVYIKKICDRRYFFIKYFIKRIFYKIY